ncbi:hypothetical protein DRQ21_11030 [Candidatus Fermentibacteria bacterium]|nr:MAG: hypothetical protein DRQ21_11030 [Candidatus Fermentibacteria bacterium]
MLLGISRLEKSLIALSMLLGLLHVLSFGFCLQDDAYIGLRYSRNLSDGNGLVFNPNEHVEGYTNFSWIIISTIPFLTGIDEIIFLRVLSALSAALAILMVGILANILARGRSGAAFFASFIFASLPFAMGEAAMGLETLFFTAVIIASLARYFLENEDSCRKGYGSGLLLALGALTRPETIGIAAFLAVIDLIKWRKNPKNAEFRNQLLSRWAVFAVPVFIHLAFRIFYYGDIVPNTFHAKVGGGLNAIRRGIRYTGIYIRDVAPLFVVLIGSFFTIAKKRNRFKADFQLKLSLVLVVCNIAYVIYVGGDFKPSNRFFVLMSAVITAVTGSLLSSAVQTMKKQKLVVWIVAVIMVASGNYLLGGAVRKYARRRASVLPHHIVTGRWLLQNFPTDTWMATGNAGVLPYESGLLTIDMHGLCDKTIARRSIPGMGLATPGHEKGDGLYVLSRHPDIILFMKSRFSSHPLTTAEIQDELFGVSELELWINPYFHENYTLVSVPIEDFYFNYFTKLQTE